MFLHSLGSIAVKALVYLNVNILLALLVAGCLPATTYAQMQTVIGIQPGPGLYWASVAFMTALCTMTQFTQQIGAAAMKIATLIKNHGWRFFVSAIVAEFTMLAGIAARPDGWEIGNNMLWPFWGSVAALTAYGWIVWVLWSEGRLQHWAGSAAHIIFNFSVSIVTTLREIADDIDEKNEKMEEAVISYVGERLTPRPKLALVEPHVEAVAETSFLANLKYDIRYLMYFHGEQILLTCALSLLGMLFAAPLLFPGETPVLTSVSFWITATFTMATMSGLWIWHAETQILNAEAEDFLETLPEEGAAFIFEFGLEDDPTTVDEERASMVEALRRNNTQVA